MTESDLKELIIFKNFSNSETVSKAVSLFCDYDRNVYIEIQRAMVEAYDDFVLDRTCWKNFIVNMLAGSENLFSNMAEKNEKSMESSIWKLAELEISTIMELYNLDIKTLSRQTGGDSSDLCSNGGNPIQNIAASLPLEPYTGHRRMDVMNALESGDAHIATEQLFEYWRKYGSGILENNLVFEWDSGLVGIKNYDTIRLADIIGYEMEKEALTENTRFLLEGKSAANVLLYGDSGTGKSSSVKAMISEFGESGLKLIDVRKDQIEQLPYILEYVGDRGSKFLIFIDDLSFEENEIEYKQFKSILEGNVKCRNNNSAIYVTSNRRNIVREVWSEREGSDDIHLRDTLQEKKSLSDRFGMVITYSAPTKEEYLDIVTGLATRNGISIDDELIAEALKWGVRRGGRSGRTARYFIDYCLAKGQ